MTITHAVSTERLVNILHAVALQSQTGLLHVERADEGESERGEIFFEQGDTVFARTAKEAGEAALSRMMGWKEVNVSFHEGVVASAELRRQHRIAPRSAETGVLLPIELQKTRLLPVMRRALAVPATGRELLRQTPASEIPAVLQRPGSRGQPAMQRQIRWDMPLSRPAPGDEARRVDAGSIFRVRSGVVSQNVIHRLDRRERLVFLLLDGRRSIREVARLIHRGETDVARILARFGALGLIEWAKAT